MLFKQGTWNQGWEPWLLRLVLQEPFSCISLWKLPAIEVQLVLKHVILYIHTAEHGIHLWKVHRLPRLVTVPNRFLSVPPLDSLHSPTTSSGHRAGDGRRANRDRAGEQMYSLLEELGQETGAPKMCISSTKLPSLRLP